MIIFSLCSRGDSGVGTAIARAVSPDDAAAPATEVRFGRLGAER